MSFGRESEREQEEPKENSKIRWESKPKNDQKWLTLRITVKKPEKKVYFGRESESKQEKPKENSKKRWESKEKSIKHQKSSKKA